MAWQAGGARRGVFGLGTRYDFKYRRQEKLIPVFTKCKHAKNGEYRYLWGTFIVNGQRVAFKLGPASAGAVEKFKARGGGRESRAGGDFSHWMSLRARPRRGFARRGGRSFGFGGAGRSFRRGYSGGGGFRRWGGS